MKKAQELSEDAKILREFGVIYDPKQTLSQFGGLKPFLMLIEKMNLRARLEKEFGYYKARTVLQYVVGLVAGADSMLKIGELSKDPLIKLFLKDPVEEAQLGRDFKKFEQEDLEKFHSFNIAMSIFDFIDKVPQDEELVFDIDATPKIKYGKQEGVEKGYVGGDHPENCLQYLFIRLENRNTFLYGTVRNGSSHSQKDFCSYLNNFLPMFKHARKSKWRGDSGYYNEKAFDIFTKNDVSFYIKAPMMSFRTAICEGSEDITWQDFGDGVSYASRMTVTDEGSKFREIYKRTEKKDAQLDLLTGVEYRYDCIATNDLVMKEDEVFKFYNKRANIENNIKELKYDYKLGQIVAHEMKANDAITQATMLAYMLIQHMKHEYLPEKMQRNRLSTLRGSLFLTPGRILSMSRKLYLRIQNVFTSEEVYAKIFKSLKEKTSCFIDPIPIIRVPVH